jgi:myo-inositol 2-dehydrogenase/D-chiro-inositol 1-dehydrogenase
MIAGEHVRAYTASLGARVVAVADPVQAKAERLAADVGAVVVPDLDAILALGVDVVSVCTPPLTHCRIAVRALEAGCSVLCEKPLARTLADARHIVEVARSAPGVLMVGQVARFEPDHAAAKAVIDSGQLGTVRMVSHSMTTAVPHWSEGHWFADVGQSGGPLLDLGVHSFDYLSWVTSGTAVRVHAVGPAAPPSGYRYALSTVRYDNGAIGTVESSWAHPWSRGFLVRVEVVGTEGRLSWDSDGLVSGMLHRDGREPVRFEPLGSRGFEAEISRFVEAVRNGFASPVPAEVGFDAARTALAALESIETGRTVDLTSWGLS